MSKKTTLEDILGTPEDYQAAQAAKKKEFDDLCARYRGKLLQESRAKFESQLLDKTKLNPKGSDDPAVAMQWNGWQACMDFSPRLKFFKMEIVLPADETSRMWALDEFNSMLRAYIGAMCRTWAAGSSPYDSLLNDVEKYMAQARVILPESEYNSFRVGIVNHGGRSEHLMQHLTRKETD
jgi:hypothetical protein